MIAHDFELVGYVFKNTHAIVADRADFAMHWHVSLHDLAPKTMHNTLHPQTHAQQRDCGA